MPDRIVDSAYRLRLGSGLAADGRAKSVPGKGSEYIALETRRPRRVQDARLLRLHRRALTVRRERRERWIDGRRRRLVGALRRKREVDRRQHRERKELDLRAPVLSGLRIGRPNDRRFAVAR